MGWTEHLAMPEPEPADAADPEPIEDAHANPWLVPRTGDHDDGELHPRARDVVFSDAPRGSVRSLAERSRVTRDSLTSLRGMQVAGAAAFTIMAWFIVVRGVLGDGHWPMGVFAVLGVLVPLLTRAIVHEQLRNEFWHAWCASRGFEPGAAEGPGRILPGNLNRSPMFGSLEERVVEHAARRLLCGREAVVGTVLRTVAPADDLDPRSAPSVHRATFVVMPIPEVAAARWAGASVRADHHARRPLAHRTMLGALVPSGLPEARCHLAAVQEQDPHLLHRIVDERMERYLHEHPVDVDVVGELLVVMRDGGAQEAEPLDELCRDALLWHELLVAEHELPRSEAPAPLQLVDADAEPVVDRSREGWGEQVQELHDWDDGQPQQLAA